MPFVQANGISIYHEIYGEGPPLILISGYTQTHLSWIELIPFFEKHFQVVVFDNRGVGETESPEEGYSTEIFAKDVIGLMDQLNIEAAHFVGESMGTLIIQQLCISHRNRVKKGVLCAPFSKTPTITLHNIHTQLKMLANGIERKHLDELNAAWLFSNHFFINPNNLKEYLEKTQRDPNPPTLSGLQSQANALEEDFSGKIKNISHEILLLAGEQDILTPLYCAEFMHQQIPHSHLHVFKEMGHLFNYEIPHKSAKKILNFLV